MTEPDVLADFQDRVNQFVAECLANYDPLRHAKGKSIRDAIWGTNLYFPWEVAILDCPLLQRLRDVRQTGLAFLVYPTALHTRFDHTLGMMTVASRIVRSINEKYRHLEDPRVSHADHMRIRLSALLHDVGHSCLSHVSETIYGSSGDFKALTRQINSVYGVRPKPHEIMSWLIVRSDPFKLFMDDLKKKNILTDWSYDRGDMDSIAGNIIGYRKDPTEKFLADIINGPMDADKLDYLVRDAYFAGPTVVYDLDRFLHTVDAIEYPRDPSLGDQDTRVVRLSIPIEGVTALEQIIISKLMLFSYLYHHQKIRCVEGMYHEVLKRWIEISKPSPKVGKLPILDHPVSFLRVSDGSLAPNAWPVEIPGDKALSELRGMLMRRELYKRALIISRLFVLGVDTEPQVKSGFDALIGCGESTADRDSLRQKLADEALRLMSLKHHKGKTEKLRKMFGVRHVLLDIPKSPTVEETEAVMIPVSSEVGAPDAQYIPLIDVFPIGKWVDAYNAIKWRGHVFTIEEAVPYVNAAALNVLSGPPYHLQFTCQATDLCKIYGAIEGTYGTDLVWTPTDKPGP
jgi:HD superfamily phosphohydrolase